MMRPGGWCGLVVAMCAATFAACRSAPAPQFMVTAEPIDIGFGPAALHCVAIDPRDSQGVWWWQPGASGCDSRSTAPTVFPAEKARVSRTGRRGPLDVRFSVPTHSRTRPYIDVALVVDADRVRVQGTGAESRVTLRDTLDLPESAPWRRAG